MIIAPAVTLVMTFTAVNKFTGHRLLTERKKNCTEEVVYLSGSFTAAAAEGIILL